jgi:omega-6 fatty acid desaturase (delta-12 desaturase)
MNQDKSQKDDLKPSWIQIVSKYNFPDRVKSWWQIVNSVVPFIIIWITMVWSLQVSYFLTLFLAVFAAGFMVRIFIIFHDCGHGSFFRSKKLNKIVGIITGLFTFTPYHKWHRDHKEHHSTVGNLEKRGVGDVKTLTIEEYLSLSKWERFAYRVYRNPIILFGIAPVFLFTIQSRFTKKYMSFRERLYVHLTSVASIGIVLLMIWAIGLKAFLMIQLPVFYLATMMGLWLFYVQHQFENVMWTHTENWDYKTVALEGSSYYKLPKLLQWFTGNIGFHHIHHLSPKIPNYKLPKCHKQNSVFQDVETLTFFSSFKSMNLRLWNEKTQKLVSFRSINKSIFSI